MADIATGIVSKLRDEAAVAAIIGTCIYPSYDRQSDRDYPLVVYKLDVSPITDFDGPTGVMSGVLNIAAIADTYAQAVALGKALYAALESQQGDWGGVTVQGCFMQDDGERDENVTDPTTEEILKYVKNFTFDLTFNA